MDSGEEMDGHNNDNKHNTSDDDRGNESNDKGKGSDGDDRKADHNDNGDGNYKNDAQRPSMAVCGNSKSHKNSSETR